MAFPYRATPLLAPWGPAPAEIPQRRRSGGGGVAASEIDQQ